MLPLGAGESQPAALALAATWLSMTTDHRHVELRAEGGTQAGHREGTLRRARIAGSQLEHSEAQPSIARIRGGGWSWWQSHFFVGCAAPCHCKLRRSASNRRKIKMRLSGKAPHQPFGYHCACGIHSSSVTTLKIYTNSHSRSLTMAVVSYGSTRLHPLF